MRKTAKILFAAATLTALFAFPALANFSWQVDNMDTDYVGTATVTLKDWEGNTYQETAPVVKSGAAVTFTELDASSEFMFPLMIQKGIPLRVSAGRGFPEP